MTTDQILYYADQDVVFADTATLAHLNEPQYVLRQWIQLSAPCDSCSVSTGLPGVVQVVVKAPTAVESANLNTAFDGAVSHVVEVETAALNNGQPVNTGFQVLQSTQSGFAVPTKVTVQKVENSRPVRALAGLLIGLLLGILVALARGLMDKRVTSASRAQGALGYPVVAEIPTVSSDSGEAYRMLWLSVFREPLPEVAGQGDQWLEGVELTSDSGSWPGSGR
jgi:hypothetical protein